MIDIDEEVLQALRREAGRAGTPLHETVNRVLRLGLERLQPEGAPYQCPTFSMGFPPSDNPEKALALAAALEDDESLHKLKQKL